MEHTFVKKTLQCYGPRSECSLCGGEHMYDISKDMLQNFYKIVKVKAFYNDNDHAADGNTSTQLYNAFSLDNTFVPANQV